MLLLLSHALAGSPPDDVRLLRVSDRLLRTSLDAERPELVVVVLETTPDADIDALVDACESQGWWVQAEARGLIQVEVGWADLADLAALAGVSRVREPMIASAKEEVTEGKEVIFLEDWHQQGIDGSGVEIAILDVGFSGWEGLVGEELPADTVDHGVTGTSDHGTAVAEIIHDLAPGATLHLWQFQTEVEFFEVLEEVMQEDIPIINASIGFDNVWHADGTSPFSLAVDQVSDSGIVYVAAAGNETGRYRIGELTDADGDGWAEIGGEDSVRVTNASGGVKVSLRWSETFGESSIDLDLVVLDDEGNECAAGEEVQDGDDYPFESLECVTGGSFLYAWIRVDDLPEGASLDGLTAYIYAPYGVSQPSEVSTLTLPADAAGAVAVGAYEIDSLELLEYSSRGPTDDGRVKPDFVAPSGVSTAAYGLPFEGTSASTPHVTGVVALILDRQKKARPDDVYAILQEQAEDLGEPGQDNAFGHGAVHTLQLPARCSCSAAHPGGAALMLLLLLLRRRPC